MASVPDYRRFENFVLTIYGKIERIRSVNVARISIKPDFIG